jgi:RES domain-containing protein
VTEAITVWRLYPRRSAEEAFSGNAASKYGGRWNFPGTRVVYFAESRSLAALESLVHVEASKDLATMDWLVTALALPSSWIERPSSYPRHWAAYPHNQATQSFGTTWARSRSTVALRVPSAIISGEFNYMINPEHPDFAKLRPEPAIAFRFDSRLLD